jgi:cell division cycle 2-like protein
MSTLSGTSSPSRKRSKWDEAEDGESTSTPVVPVPKRRAKQKPTEPFDSDASTSPAVPPSSSQTPNRPSHSIFVPPRSHHPPILASRSVYCYERLNQIEEGSYGVVFRARDKTTGDIVALKKLKLDEEKQGFPITALREINALMSCRHENVVAIREVVVGDTLTQYVS